MINYKNKGFTILELMIATSIFSVILLTTSVLITQIGKMYYKGINYSRTQSVNRNIVNDIAREIQFTNTPISSVGNEICIGSTQYKYNINIPVGVGTGLLKKTNSTDPCGSMNISDATEMLGDNMRLEKFEITPTPSNNRIVNIKIQVVYASGGNNPSSPGQDLLTKADNITLNSIGPDSTILCNSEKGGSQWCATSYITTTVYRRASII